MITNVCLLLEILSFTFCLHMLYGEKFKLDIATISLLSVCMIILAAMNYYDSPSIYSMIIYPIMFIYCGVRFEFKIKLILINLVFCVVIVGVIQIVTMLPFWFLRITWLSNFRLLIAECFAFSIVLFSLPKCKINKVMIYLQEKEKIQNIVLIICILLITFLLLSYKEFKIYEVIQTLLLFISIICIFFLAERMGKYKIKAKEVETELKMHMLYADSFQGLIENIRLRQHEFDNHINTIYSQHYIYETYDELVNAQNAYCKIISKENRFNKLLKSDNPIITGFLYGKFIEIEKLGIDVNYYVKINELNTIIPVYKIVEILGDLINNATEAIEKMEGVNKLYVSLIEDKKFEIEVRNESPIIDLNEIDKFFVKGFSSKGRNRGLGLYNVKNICKEYGFEIYCENVEINKANWVSFKVIGEKYTV